MTLLSDSEAALRSLSVVVGIGTMAVTWRWARDAVGSTSALIAAALVALSPALVFSSRDTRMYSLETFFATTGWWLLWLLVARGRDWLPWRRRVVAVGLLILVASEVWTMSLGIPTAGLQLAFALIALLWLRNRAAATAAVCVLIGALSLAPWLPISSRWPRTDRPSGPLDPISGPWRPLWGRGSSAIWEECGPSPWW